MADFQQLSDVLVLVVQKATAAILERVAVLEQSNADLRAQVKEQAAVRDRIVVLETKSAMAVATDWEAIIAPIRDRLVAVENKAAQPVVVPEPDLSGLGHRLSNLELVTGAWPTTATKSETQIDSLSKEIGAVRERVSVVEVRAQIPGPPGPAGKDGKDGHDGLNGKDGADGLGFDDINVEDHTLVFQKGTNRKYFRLKIPEYKDIYQDGQEYHPGHIVTWGGSAWHCNSTTRTKPGEGSKDWRLMVKRGRDGKDGVDAPTLPVVKVGG